MDNATHISVANEKRFSVYMWLLSVVTLYSFHMDSFLGQLPVIKIMSGGMMIISEWILLSMAWQTFKDRLTDINIGVSLIISLTVLYNLWYILKGAIWDQNVAYMSYFGNYVYQPAFMLPLGFLLGIVPERYFQLHKCIWYYVLLMIPLFLLSGHVNVFVGMSMLFLLAFARYLPRKMRVFLLLYSVLYIVYCYYDDARVPILRILMGYAILFFSKTSFYKSRFVKLIVFAVIVPLPLYFLGLYVITGYSVFEQSSATEYVADMGTEHSGDTRTFLYEEVFEDLTETETWMFGKGINGTYHSEVFEDKFKDNEFVGRFITEVGFLNYLLKGGCVQTILYFLLLLCAIYKCLFKSQSRFAVLLGLVLLSHYLLLFVEDVPRYDLYCVALWFYNGMAFAPGVDDLDDDYFEEQLTLLYSK